MQSGVTGDWSVCDILAHVTTWEQEALKYLPTILEGSTPPRYSHDITSPTPPGVDRSLSTPSETETGIS